MEIKKISAIICAAGKGERAQFNKNKLLAPLFGAPVLYHTLKKFDIKEIDEVIVTSSKVDLKEISAICAPFGFKVVEGGATRTQSVKRALEHVTGDIVLIHDGARPYVTKEIIVNCIDSAQKFGSGVCAIKLTDTAVCAELGLVTDRLNRDDVYRVQTPQAFITEDIKYAYSLSGNEVFTDDSAVYGKFIAPPRIVEGSEDNVKLTFKRDFESNYPLPLSCKLIGFGVDVHAVCEGNCVTLGGIKIDCGFALAAHSDGDVVIHALMDALLSAAGLRDIGVYFPDSDPSLSGADSRVMLAKVRDILGAMKLEPKNISITVQAEKPKLAPHIEDMKTTLSQVLHMDKSRIAIAAGTSEKLGFVGQCLGICAYAAVTLCEVENG